MTPLVLLLLLAFGTVVVAALLVWSLLTPARRPPRAATNANASERPRPSSNDDVRGAKAPRATPRERPAGEDAFERFLRAGRDDGR